MRRALTGVFAAIALVAPAAAYAGFSPNDPLAQKQWYIEKDRAFNAFDSFNVLPQLLTVRVAVIDSGVDSNHPELRNRIVGERSFVGGSVNDVQGHGTFVAGEIAALTDNGLGIAGLAPPARLLIAKVVHDDGSISPHAEARAIRWAVRSGAKVINLSLGGVRDPGDPSVDGFSYAERSAIDYAIRSGALVVASVGNGEDAPSKPWRFASYPAALPHVLGVAAYGRSGDVPAFSNRDDVFVDIAAPGQDMLSLFPRALTKAYPACPDQGYSSCGTKEYRHADGTSYSSPQVAAAAALVFALRPDLRRRPGIGDPRADRRRRHSGGRLRRLHGRPRRADRQRPTRRGSRGALVARADSAGGSLRAERRHGPRGAGRLRRVAGGQAHARHLGRPERRLQHQAAPGSGDFRPRALREARHLDRALEAGAARPRARDRPAPCSEIDSSGGRA